MLKDIQKAIRYNLKKRGVLWAQQEIPWGHYDAGSKKFAISTAAFQGQKGLGIDGMLGPNTLEAIKVGAGDVPQLEGFLIGGKVVEVSEGIKAFANSMGDSFEAKKRTQPPEHIVIHESVTRSRESTVRILKGKGYGVHFMIDADGSITQHCDPMTESPTHANQLNSSSIGIEIVNPYYPHLWGDPWFVLEPAQWWTHVPKDKDPEWVAPTEKQIQACSALVSWLCEQIPSVPLEFPTKDLGPRKTRIKGWKDKAKPKPGIVAHRDFASHADGRGILERLFSMENEKG